ncbi:bis(5'-nucleosyl)-tetraphosphatase (symmetrical) YqeK [Clostridium hydrogeniformans]|uniref:bis(5'-nucleosyl)-tetraphosphatase (symmetrical) YqeK n=1 Tax=Clostridium hydrogeniformans TaxID=349933 RepID=UPI0004897DD8|nr:bis(5'-nucleosyl)-tetraphosphatase (symmetrical) YqeK [Clostridium hydrogeniformans]
MWTEEQIKGYLRENLKESRYIHVIGVMETAEKLATIYGEDKVKSRYAALIHDLAKHESGETLISICKNHGYTLNSVEINSPHLLHGLVGAIIAKEKMGIEDDDILNAAIFHTTGKENMTLLEKIIYIADYIEPSRDFPGVEELREITFKNLDKGLLKAFDNTIKFIIDKGLLIHQRTIEARNYIVNNK